MAKDKKSFVLYSDLIVSLEHLTYEEKGILFHHMLEYVNDKNPVLEDRLLLTAWKPIEAQLKRDLKKFEEVKAKRSEAGKRSAELRASKNDEQNSTNSTSVESVQQCSTNSTVNDNDNDNVNENVNDNVILLEKETKEENLSKENPTENFPKTDSVETGAEERKKVAQKKEKYFNKEDFKKKLLDLGVEEKHANDWIQIRKDKRASFTESAIDGIIRECEKHNFPFHEAIRNCAESNWQGFKYEWLKNKNQKTNGITNTSNTGFSTSKPSTNNSNSGKRSYRQILAARLTNELKANGEGSNITIDAEICE